MSATDEILGVDEEPTEPRPPGPLRLLASSVVTALGSPRVWLTAWLLVTVPALLGVYPVLAALDADLAHHPGASLTLDQALDVDFARRHPEAVVPWVGGSLFAFLAFTWLGGGILACVGTGRRLRYRVLLAEGGAHFLRNLRALVVGALACALVFWGTDVLDRSIREDWLYETDPGAALFGSRFLSLEVGLEALNYLWGFLFLGIVFITKLAMARMSLLDRNCALLAWGRSLLHVLRHPLRIGVLVAGFAVLWLGLSHAIGMLTAYLLEIRGNAWLGLASGQVGILANQVLVVAAFVAAREAMASTLPASAADPFEADPLAREHASLDDSPIFAGEG